MRIVGGTLRGRRLSTPRGDKTRPTTDRVREALASALQARGLLQNANVLELYAGSGALSLEALSRGAAHAVLIENDREALGCIRQNLAALGLTERARVLALDLGASRPGLNARLSVCGLPPFDLVLADPPYAAVAQAVELLAGLREAGLLAPQSAVVLEHARRAPPERPEGFGALASYTYGDTAVELWETIAPSAEP